jgi:TPR repeat protein
MNNIVISRKLKPRRRSVFLFALCFFALEMIVAGCSSTHDLKKDGFSPFGGGFSEEQLRPGLYKMSATSNFAPWPTFGAASATWKMRADQLCGIGSHKDFETVRSSGSGGNVPVLVPSGGVMVASRFNPTISGYVLCVSSSTSMAEAERHLNSLLLEIDHEAVQARTLELQQLGGASCDQGEVGVSGETYFLRGRALLELQEYTAARFCFFRSQEIEKKDSYYYKEACSFLGSMFETGLGGEKNLSKAKIWLKEAGLL